MIIISSGCTLLSVRRSAEKLTKVVSRASIAEIMIIQKQQAAALDINIFRRPTRSMKKYGLELYQWQPQNQLRGID